MQQNSIKLSVVLFLRRIFYGVLWVLGVVYNMVFPSRPRIIVLSYHSIGEDSWRFSVTLENIKEQVLWLKKSGFKFITASDLNEYLHGEKEILSPSVVFTFDDGYSDILSIQDMFRSLDIYPIAFVLSNLHEVSYEELGTSRTFLTSAQINGLIDSGWTIGCHSATHADFSKISDEQLKAEIIDSKSKLEVILKKKINLFAYPKGYYSSKILDTVRNAGYTMAFSMNDEKINRNTDPLTIPRIGVDGTHSFIEFRGAISPIAIQLRSLIKKAFSGRGIRILMDIR